MPSHVGQAADASWHAPRSCCKQAALSLAGLRPLTLCIHKHRHASSKLPHYKVLWCSLARALLVPYWLQVP